MKRFFKHVSVDQYTIDNLRNKVTYAGPINLTNDPFEGRFTMNIEDDEARKIFTQWVFNDIKGLDDDLRKLKEDVKIIDEYLGKEMQTSFTKEAYMMAKVNFALMMESVLQDMHVSCFTSKNDCIQMWGHYSDKHKGICIEYNPDDEMIKMLKKVDYISEPYIININNVSEASKYDIFTHLPDIVCKKEKEWHYEEEYRLFSGSSFINHNDNSIIAIYFGINCNEEDKKKIIDASKHYRKIKYYNMRKDPFDYKMTSFDY